jgi:signal transduction histidine kinase
MIKRLSISNQLILMMISSSMLTLFLAIATILYFNIDTIKARAVQHITILGEVIAERSTAALTFMDTAQAEKNIKALRHQKYIELACLYNSEFVIVGEYKNSNKPGTEKIKCPESIGNSLSKGLYTNEHLIWGTQIILDNSAIGYIYIVVDDSFVFEEFYEGIYQYTMIIIFVILFSFLLANRFQKFISQPIVELEFTARKIAINKDFSIRAEKRSNDEIGDLVDAFNSMLKQTKKYEQKLIVQKEQLESHQESLEITVQQRTSKLQVLNDELTSSLVQVENMQGQLIEAEKMASLGGLVAGIAHEVNTPIGICLTAASFLKERNDHLHTIYAQDKMTQEDFEEFLKIVKDSSDMILKNIQRATAIIQNFKKVAVDQSVEDKRCFNVKNYFYEIIKSLHPKLKRHNHTIEILSEDDLYINSYPGSLYQIFSNLILNSLIHGFEAIENGKIIITIRCEDNNMMIDYQDNGQGMPPAILDKVFDPFVTTKRNKGGTGLGAHIIYNVVMQQFHGHITCHSRVEEGVLFKIQMPVVLCEGDH